MTTITHLITAARTALGDSVATYARWSDDDLRSHVERAVTEYSRHLPLQLLTPLTATPGSRSLSLATLSRLQAVTAVEWPIGEFPPEYVAFAVWADSLTLNVETAPSAADTVNIYWHAGHQVDEAGSTVPDHNNPILLYGAIGYAAEQAAAQNTGAVNVAGGRSAEQWRLFARQQLTLFRSSLRTYGITGQLRTATLFVPSNQATPSQDTDPGP